MIHSNFDLVQLPTIRLVQPPRVRSIDLPRSMPAPDEDSSDSAPRPVPALRRTNREAEVVPAFADRQHGVLHRAQLYDAGWTRHQIDHEIDVGRWQQLAPEVFCRTTGSLTHRQRLWLGVLHAGPRSALAHATACIEGGLARWPSQAIHVIGAKSRAVTPISGYVFHETRRRYRQWVITGAGPPRLSIEAAALLRAERERSVKVGIGVLAAIVQQRLSTAERLFEVSLTIRKLRHGETLRLALLDIAGGAESFAEIHVGQVCRELGLRAPDRQVVRLDRDGRRRYLDCTWALDDGRTVVLEVDGSFHLSTEHWWRDIRRQRSLMADGVTIVRCSSIELRLEPGIIVRDLRALGVPRV